MPSATATNLSASGAAAPVRARTPESGFVINSAQEAELIKLDLSDLVLPKTVDLQVDGLKASFWSRLFGR